MRLQGKKRIINFAFIYKQTENSKTIYIMKDIIEPNYEKLSQWAAN